MKILAFLLVVAGLTFAQDHEGNFTIRFEPDAQLQTNAEIPFAIHVTNDLHKPVLNATVTLQIETVQHTDVKVFKAPAVTDGVYVAKPIFPSAGQWSVYVEVHRGGLMSARTIEFNVPASAAP
ncbi:MAG TPA: FixH family protein [Bryobacteraceae bacterium]